MIFYRERAPEKKTLLSLLSFQIGLNNLTYRIQLRKKNRNMFEPDRFIVFGEFKTFEKVKNYL